MSVSSFFGAIAAQFVQDMLFKRPVTVEIKRDANGNTDFKATINPSGSSPVVYQPFGYPPPYPYGYPPVQYGYQQPQPQGQPQQPSNAQQPPQPRRPYVVPQEFHR